MRCPVCHKKHRQYPFDCAWQASAHHIIHGAELCPGPSCLRNQMREYLQQIQSACDKQQSLPKDKTNTTALEEAKILATIFKQI